MSLHEQPLVSGKFLTNVVSRMTTTGIVTLSCIIASLSEKWEMIRICTGVSEVGMERKAQILKNQQEKEVGEARIRKILLWQDKVEGEV